MRKFFFFLTAIATFTSILSLPEALPFAQSNAALAQQTGYPTLEVQNNAALKQAYNTKSTQSLTASGTVLSDPTITLDKNCANSSIPGSSSQRFILDTGLTRFTGIKLLVCHDVIPGNDPVATTINGLSRNPSNGTSEMTISGTYSWINHTTLGGILVW